MEINIISYTAAQYAALTAEQLQEVRSAQIKKNKLDAAYLENLEKEKHRLTENGTLLSTMWQATQNRLYADYAKEVETLREGLLFYLHYSTKPDNSEGSEISAPYKVDYSLSDTERFQIVKDYYMETYTSANERFLAFKADEVAVQYLGELYAPLYDYFLQLESETA